MSKENLTDALMQMQALFEKTRVGTDGSLWERNTIAHGLQRGVIGEAKEALEVLRKPDAIGEYLEVSELTEEQLEDLIMEVIDVYIFLHSIFNHLGMSWVDVLEKSMTKMARNFAKYPNANFSSRTVNDSMMWSRMKWRQHEN